MKAKKIIYYISTVLISAMLLAGAANYIFNYAIAREEIITLGFPAWIIYPLAVAKTLGAVMLWIKRAECAWLKEWAYAGIVFNLLLATGAHLSVADGQQFFPLVALLLTIVSRTSLPKTEVE